MRLERDLAYAKSDFETAMGYITEEQRHTAVPIILKKKYRYGELTSGWSVLGKFYKYVYSSSAGTVFPIDRITKVSDPKRPFKVEYTNAGEKCSEQYRTLKIMTRDLNEEAYDSREGEGERREQKKLVTLRRDLAEAEKAFSQALKCDHRVILKKGVFSASLPPRTYPTEIMRLECHLGYAKGDFETALGYITEEQRRTAVPELKKKNGKLTSGWSVRGKFYKYISYWSYSNSAHRTFPIDRITKVSDPERPFKVEYTNAGEKWWKQYPTLEKMITDLSEEDYDSGSREE